MDWKHLLSLSPEELSEEDKDELFNTIAWFNSSSEEVSVRKYSALFRISQEILKYKGEQVETLIHELDELAIKQGEEEAKRGDSDTEGRSSKSRIRSSSIEVENLEQKYLELRTKYKKQVKSNEKYLAEIEKLQKSIQILNQEKQNLQSELQLVHGRDDSQSDISENAHEQNKELVNSLHNKNKQISDLLHDIEEVEKENLILREKLTSVKDELATATQEMTTISENFKSSKAELDECHEMIQRLRSENEVLANDAEIVLEQKQELQSQLEEFTKEVNARIDIWKNLLQAKEDEIQKLKQTAQDKQELSSTPSMQSYENEHSDLTALNRVLSQREHQLLEVKTQLQAATRDMEESTQIIRKLHSENELGLKKINELTSTVTSLTDQVKTAHRRCQELQEQLAFSENDREDKQKDLRDIVAKLGHKGQTDLAQYINEMQELKAQKRVLEKQVMNLVKTTNKLQDSLEQYSRENELLRDKLGIPEDEIICTDAITIKHKLQMKDAEKMRKQAINLEEENIRMKNEIHKLNKNVAILCHQLMNINEKPNVQIDAEYEISTNKIYKQEMKMLSEENEALRKGLHEILDSVHSKKRTSSKEIKSETLEKLLRALDVKHISGWYHPAMRLQAELHNEQGISAELREQLRQVRSELSHLKKEKGGEETRDSVSGKSNEQASVPGQKQDTLPSTKMIGSPKYAQGKIKSREEFLSEQPDTNQTELIENYKKMELSLQEELEKMKNKVKELSQENEITAAQLKALVENEPESSPVQKLSREIEKSIVLNRKNAYLEDLNTRLRNDILNLKSDIMATTAELMEKINEYSLGNHCLKNQMKIYESKIEVMVDSDRYKELQDKLDTTLVKYRELLHNFQNVDQNRQLEADFLKKSGELLRIERDELKVKMTELLNKIHTCKETGDTVDSKVQVLSKKLSETEVNEISERQRANHTNSLYELVREQLHKSEERFKEFEKYNKEILRKNLILQEQLKDVENKISCSIEDSSYINLEKKYTDILNENSKITQQLTNARYKCQEFEVKMNSTKLWTSLQEQELLSLKHQIVDLQASTDEKTVIARISGDIIQARANEELWKAKFESLNKEYNECQQKYRTCQTALQNADTENAEKQNQLRKKIRILEELLVKKKFQYFGCVPLISEEQFVKNLRQLFDAKHDALKTLDEVESIKRDTLVLKEQAEIELANVKTTQNLLSKNDVEVKKLLKWQQEKKSILLNEVKFKRQLEFKEMQLNHALQRLQMQDSHLMKLEEELLLSHHNFDLDVSEMSEGEIESPKTAPKEEAELRSEDVKKSVIEKQLKTQEIQTVEVLETKSDSKEDTDTNLRIELLNANNDLSIKNQLIEQLKGKITELEMNINLLKKQLADKQSQISFYEKHIMELQSKKENTTANSIPNSIQVITDETAALKTNIKCLQESLSQKDQSLLQMQSLLKQDRDKHSLAAARMQDEMKVLTKSLNEEKKKSAELQKLSEETHPSKAAIEQYIIQVHALEAHAAELHTKVTSSESQLQASREEAVRWRTLASDRLNALDELRITLGEQHKAEIAVYKRECEKWRSEVNGLKELISKHTSEFENAGSDLSRIMKDKDNKINELTIALRQASNDSKRIAEKFELNEANKLLELESANEQLIKEHEALRKRFDQLLNRERSRQEEIRELRGQLVKKPVTARSDKSEKSIRDQLQKKIASLEKEIEELQIKLQAQININEQHRLRAAEDFDRWKKQKQWQQTIDKLKNKLKEKESETEKLQQTTSGYRILIERLEREKHNLENRVKNIKSAAATNNSDRIENLKVENMKLIDEMEKLRSRLEIQQHHSGSLGAAMLQEKLESQERKIAILELSAKGTVEIRAELERLQTSTSNLQKKNIFLEAENLELKLDLEKSSKEVPYLRDQIIHLENYVDALKKETEAQLNETSKDNSRAHSPTVKQVSELEKTVFILKRVVEKLQAENKRLLSGRRSLSDRPSSSEKLRRDHHRLKEQYTETVQKVANLERELGLAHKKMQILESVGDRDGFSSLFNELSQTREQLHHKSQMLEKVKLLLQRAAAREKALLEQISQLQGEGFQIRRESVSSDN